MKNIHWLDLLTLSAVCIGGAFLVGTSAPLLGVILLFAGLYYLGKAVAKIRLEETER